MLSNILTAQNFSMPACYLKDGGAKYTVKVGDTFKDLDELKNLMLVDMGIDGMDDFRQEARTAGAQSKESNGLFPERML